VAGRDFMQTLSQNKPPEHIPEAVPSANAGVTATAGVTMAS
jgi:hypothetical protein